MCHQRFETAIKTRKTFENIKKAPKKVRNTENIQKINNLTVTIKAQASKHRKCSITRHSVKYQIHSH